MSRRPLLAGNWKMYKTSAEAAALVKGLLDGLGKITDRDIVVAPPYTSLVSIASLVKGSPIALSAQNLFWEKEGAFTGEVSAEMLKEIGCSHAIIGHSERRQFFDETDETVKKKTAAALRADLTPIVCVGEKLAERESEQTLSVIERQLKNGLSGFTEVQVSKMVVAYEPVWAIGTGKTATPDQAQEVHAMIRKWIRSQWGAVADATRILYGGSVKPDNVAALMDQPDIDGGLVGGASLKAADFLAIIHG